MTKPLNTLIHFSDALYCIESLQNNLLHPSVAKVLGEKFMELGNLLLISLVVTEALQIHVRSTPIGIGLFVFLLYYTLGVLILKNGKETP